MNTPQSTRPTTSLWLAEENVRRPSPIASLLVAALVVLRHPCARNKSAARLLLDRAAADPSLTPAEREACRSLAEDIDIDREDSPTVQLAPVAHALRKDWERARGGGHGGTSSRAASV